MSLPLTYIKTGRPEYDDLVKRVAHFLDCDALNLNIDGTAIRGYRTPDAKSFWIRDYSDMMRGFRYFESDLKSTVQHFADTQSVNGRIFDYFTTFPEKLPCERENWTKYVRVPVEADVEFRFIKAACLAWQACGDDDWLRLLLPSMEKALHYIFNHPWYWDKKKNLVKRAYTIDTWDFAYTAGQHDWLQFQINDKTFWGIMHGDNSGYFEACKLMSKVYEYFNNEVKSQFWKEKAEEIYFNMNKVCWNGSFYTHFVKLGDFSIPDVDESRQLSLSNSMNINRGAADHQQAVSIIREYQKRRKSEVFAEWFSIDPAFPDGVFGDEKLIKGAYVNGGIMPLVGGEIARAAFEHGFEDYGVSILKQYYSMIKKKNETYLWYFHDGTPASVETSTSPEAEPTDGWGSSAMLYALLEGMAGVVDRGRVFDKIILSPRWLSDSVTKAEVRAGYPASGIYVFYNFEYSGDRIRLDVETKSSQITFHVLLPAGRNAAAVRCKNKEIKFCNTKIENSSYVDFEFQVSGKMDFTVILN